MWNYKVDIGKGVLKKTIQIQTVFGVHSLNFAVCKMDEINVLVFEGLAKRPTTEFGAIDIADMEQSLFL